MGGKEKSENIKVTKQILNFLKEKIIFKRSSSAKGQKSLAEYYRYQSIHQI